ncbi:hypothetical protein HK103_000990 [Boothiomyces macroporosus]|uniref:Uncharacterized protein n=1 Tax=Boothiomyces macroporosus TaxID=261099 RepID=A0AAD5UEB3_9FUNG|nr:hypothetical protein HK103_000990 [Boothiomyces macroporosus]
MDIFYNQHGNKIYFTNNSIQEIRVSTASHRDWVTVKPGSTHDWPAKAWDFVILFKREWQKQNLGANGFFGVYTAPGSHIYFSKPVIHKPKNVVLKPSTESKILVKNNSEEKLSIWSRNKEKSIALQPHTLADEQGPEFFIFKESDGHSYGFLCPQNTVVEVMTRKQALGTKKLEIFSCKLKQVLAKTKNGLIFPKLISKLYKEL